MKFLLYTVAIGLITSSTLAAADVAESFRSQVLPVLQSHCVACHAPGKEQEEIDLSGARSAEQLVKQQHLWYRVLDQLQFVTMPPEDAKQPTDAQRQAVQRWIEGDLTNLLAAEQLRQGRSRFRRLSRSEYSNTFEDLFGYRPDPSLLPEDGRVDGFTKVSAALPMTNDGAFGYYKIAQELVDKWVLGRLPKVDDPRSARVQRMAARDSGQSPGHTLELPDGWWVSFNSDDTSGRVQGIGPRTPGRYKVRIHVYGYQTDKPMPIGIYTGKTHTYPQQIQLQDIVMAPPGKPAVLETEVLLTQHDGFGLRPVPLGIGVQVPKNQQASKCQGPGMALQWLEHEGPEFPMQGDRWLTADLPEELVSDLRARPWKFKGSNLYTKVSREEFMGYLRKSLARVGPRIFRRDLTESELNGLLETANNLLDEEATIAAAFKEPFVELLTSPQFFCVLESPGELSDFALASRLSYFLWNSAPDDELLAVAREGRLRDPAELRKQTYRLLDDPKSARFVEDFLDQWLNLHAIDDTTPDNKLYPEYDDALKFASVRETKATFARMLKENRSVRDFVAPTWMLIDYRLAQHYGMGDVNTASLQSLSVPKDSSYGGIWTQPAILKVTADGSSTSPVKRGVWIARRLLGTQISPPPPNIEPINPDTSGATTVREQLALHSAGGSCASCHKKFDPYGFVLESFDVMGQHRTRYRVLDEKLAALPPNQRQGKQLWNDGLEVDCSGVTPEGEPFENISELRKLLARQPEKLAHGVTWHMITYATGEPSGPLDRRAIAEIVDSAKKDDYGLRSLVHGLVQSKLFRCK